MPLMRWERVLDVGHPDDGQDGRELLLIDQLAPVLDVAHHGRLDEVARSIDDRTARNDSPIPVRHVQVVTGKSRRLSPRKPRLQVNKATAGIECCARQLSVQHPVAGR